MTAANLLLCCHLAVFGTADPEQSVTAGRKALERWGRYPWYDAETDGLRPLDVSEPWDWGFLLDYFEKLFQLFPFSISGRWIQVLAWALLAALLATLVYVLVRAFLNRRSGRAKAGAKGDPSDVVDDRRRFEALPGTVGRRRSNLLEEARRHYLEGNYAEAIIYLFSHQLVRLDKHQLIRLAKGKTNRQYLRELGPRETLRQLFGQTMRTFEDVFFGNYTIDQARFEACWLQLDEFETLATRETL